MAVRQNIGVGGLYPTGRAPLAFDLSQTASMIGQRMIKREEQRIAGEKGEMEKSQMELLKALDFETVQGLTGEIQQKHLENVNGLWDKWADVYSKRQGKLSFSDLRELKKDQTKVQYDLGRMQANVKEFAFAQQALTKPDALELWDPQSWSNLKEYAKKGVGGEGALDILVRRPPSFLEYVYDKFKPMVATLNKQFSYNIQKAIGPDGMEHAVKTNEDLALQNWQAVREQPGVQAYIGKYGEEAVKGQFMNALGITLTQDKFYPQVLTAAMRADQNKNTNALARKYGANVNDDQVDNWTYMNNVLEGLAQGDKPTWEMLQGSTFDGFYVDKIDIGKEDGKAFVTLIGKKPASGKAPTRIVYLPDRNNSTVVKNWKIDKLGVMPTQMGGKQLDKNLAGKVISDWYEYKSKETLTPQKLKKVTDRIANAASTRARIVEEIGLSFPELKVEKPILKRSIIKIKLDKEDPGTDYDISTQEGKDALSTFLRDYSGADKLGEGLGPGGTPPQEETEGGEELKSLVDQYGYDAVVDQYMKQDSTLTRQQVIDAFSQRGIVKK